MRFRQGSRQSKPQPFILRELVDIASDAEVHPFLTQKKSPEFAVPGQFLDSAGKIAEHRRVQAVAVFRPVEREDSRVSVDLQAHCLHLLISNSAAAPIPPPMHIVTTA